MNPVKCNGCSDRVVSLHLHPLEPGALLTTVDSIEVVTGKGVLNDTRFFGRLSKDTGQPSRRQVSLMEREQIAGHAAALGLPAIPLDAKMDAVCQWLRKLMQNSRQGVMAQVVRSGNGLIAHSSACVAWLVRTGCSVVSTRAPSA